MSEQSEVVRPILDALNAAGVLAWRCQSGCVRVRGAWMQLAPKGTPDIIGALHDGRMFGVECKRREGKHMESEEQRAWGERLTRLGGVYVLARSVDEALVGLGLIREIKIHAVSGGGVKTAVQDETIISTKSKALHRSSAAIRRTNEVTKNVSR